MAKDEAKLVPEEKPERRILRELFVYGTLMRGMRAEDILTSGVKAEFVREAETGDGWEIADCGPYPALRPGEGRVVGELWRLPEDSRKLDLAVRGLDGYEGVYSGLYRPVIVTLEDGTEAMAYAAGSRIGARRPRIPSGSWREHYESRMRA